VRVRALFAAALVLATSACDKQPGTPSWDSTSASPNTTSGIASPAPHISPAASTAAPAKPAPVVSTPDATSAALRFIAYNVENWLTMDRYVDQKLVTGAPKPAAEKQAAIAILVRNCPDIVGLCEIGETPDLAEIQQALKTAGLDLPYSRHHGGSDPARHLGLLSRFPISPPDEPAPTEFQMKGQTFAINRGILDARIQARGKSYRLLGVHLKSKREIEGADQEEMRLQEARLLRRHVESILKNDPNARLMVYGDFNDTRPSNTFKTVTGTYNEPDYLTAIPFKDTRGEAWTHYWEIHDIYSRFDFIAVSRALKPDVDFHASHIIEDPAWSAASDHRPLLAIFR
jgi:endonuclease/exonuclease/phosphatase family metal-dependent hydrolase